MKNGRFGPFWAVLVGREGWKIGAEGSKMAQKGGFVQPFLRFFALLRSFLSTPNFQKSTPQKNLALTLESEKAKKFGNFNLTSCCLER